jgi:hypothetical protein
MDFDQMSEDQLCATMNAGRLAEQELSRRISARAAIVEEREARVLSGDHAAAFSADELRFVAFHRCPCGAGMAYPKNGSVRGAWHCSAVLRGTAASTAIAHSPPLLFSVYEIKSENQPSANGATTRDEPKGGE